MTSLKNSRVKDADRWINDHIAILYAAAKCDLTRSKLVKKGFMRAAANLIIEAKTRRKLKVGVITSSFMRFDARKLKKRHKHI